MQICVVPTNILYLIFILPVNVKYKVALWSTSKQIHLAIVDGVIVVMRDVPPQRTNFSWRLNWWDSFIALVKRLRRKFFKRFLNYLWNQMLNTNIIVLIQYKRQLILPLDEIIFLNPKLYFCLCIPAGPP